MPKPTASLGRALTLTAPCDPAAIRTACLDIRAFLAEARLPEAELDPWELVLAEAGNNAVSHAHEAGLQQPVRFDVSVSTGAVEVRVTDHTPGFDLPEKAELPPPDSEHGRGVYLIQTLTGEARYLRGRGENCLVLRKARAQLAPSPARESAGSLQSQLNEAHRTLDLMTEELASAFESLSAVFRFSAELTGQSSPEVLARKWLEELLATVQADWFVFRLAEPDGRALRLAAHAGRVPAVPSYSLEPADQASAPVEVRAALARKDVWFDPTTPRIPGATAPELFVSGCGFSHPIVINEHLVGVVTFGRHNPEDAFKAAQVNVIETFADFLGFQIRNAQLQEERTQDRLVTRELEIAADIQQSLLPVRLPDLAGFHLASHYRSARHVGGDFYDALTTPYDAIATAGGGLLLVMADVMGKGIPAALFATIFRTLIHARPELAPMPGRFLSWVNRSFAEDLGRVDMFVTAQLAFIDPVARQLRVAGAGHPPLFLADASGRVRAHESGGPPLGILPSTDYPEETLPLPPGARLMLYTDGLNEARNPAGDLLGLEALQQHFAQTAKERLPVGETKERLIAWVAHFESGTPQADDQAFLLLAED
jgi:serine phosphatase RsbU (regulator of sigma subunit)/anti-sigma regulatory factor (Ser/Thr protein kinase)